MTTKYLGVKDIADLLGIKASTLSSYIAKGMLPEPDVIIGTGEKAIRGWTQENIVAWHSNRPGKGNRTPRK